jgi:hypothetical protein
MRKKRRKVYSMEENLFVVTGFVTHARVVEGTLCVTVQQCPCGARGRHQRSSGGALTLSLTLSLA